MNIGQGEAGSRGRESFQFRRRDVERKGVFSRLLQKEKIAPQGAKFAQEEAHVRTLGKDFSHKTSDGGNILGGQGVEDPFHDFPPGQSKHLARLPGRKRLAGGATQRKRLPEERHGIANATRRPPGNEAHGFRLKEPFFPLQNIADMRHKNRFGKLAEHKMLAAAQNGHRELMLFCRGQDKGNARRWLLKRFQEGVEGLLGKHVGFVDDEDLVAAFQGGVAHGVAQAADIVDAAVGSAVYLQHIHKVSLGDTAAGVALVARLARRGLFAVERLGKNARHGRLAHAACAAEQIGRRYTVFLCGAGEYGLCHILPHHLGEGLRSVQGCQRSVCHILLPLS